MSIACCGRPAHQSSMASVLCVCSSGLKFSAPHMHSLAKLCNRPPPRTPSKQALKTVKALVSALLVSKLISGSRCDEG